MKIIAIYDGVIFAFMMRGRAEKHTDSCRNGYFLSNLHGKGIFVFLSLYHFYIYGIFLFEKRKKTVENCC